MADTFENVADRRASLLRKALRGTVLVGKYDDVEPVTSLVAPNGQIEVPEGYESVGWISEDGLSFSRDREISDIRGWGSGSFLRRDIQSEDHTLSFTALETKRLTHELRAGRDLTDNTVSPDGEWSYEIEERPGVFYWRVIALGVDGQGDNLIYTARVYHRCTVTEMDDESWTDGDETLNYNVTLSAVPDEEMQSLGQEFIFGPGLLNLAENMGLEVSGS